METRERFPAWLLEPIPKHVPDFVRLSFAGWKSPVNQRKITSNAAQSGKKRDCASHHFPNHFDCMISADNHGYDWL